MEVLQVHTYCYSSIRSLRVGLLHLMLANLLTICRSPCLGLNLIDGSRIVCLHSRISGGVIGSTLSTTLSYRVMATVM